MDFEAENAKHRKEFEAEVRALQDEINAIRARRIKRKVKSDALVHKTKWTELIGDHYDA
jgi:hypothetical protein